MAVAFDAVGPTAACKEVASVAAFSWTHTAGAGGGTVLAFLTVGVTGASAGQIGSFASVTYGGNAMTLLSSTASNSSTFGGIFVYGITGQAAGANTVAVGIYTPPTGSTYAQTIGASLSFTGGSTFGTPPAPVTGSAATGSLAFPATSTGGMCVAGACDGTGAEAVTAGTQRFKLDQSGSNTGNTVGATLASAGGTTTITFTWTSDYFGIVGVEIKSPGGQNERVPQQLSRINKHRRGAAQQQQYAFQLPGATVSPPTVVATASIPAVQPVAQFPYITGLSGTTSAAYFTDQNSNPRLMFCDASWPVVYSAGRFSGSYTTDITTLVNTRSSPTGAGGGYTALEFNLLPNGEYAAYTGKNVAGYYPFTGGASQDPTTGLNNNYWQVLDYLISAMAAKGMTAFCNLLMGEDLSSGVAGSWTNAQFQAYGNAVATRYASYPNIIWMMGDDGGTGATGPTEIMIGVRAAGDTRPVSFENAQETTSRYGLKLNDVQQWVSSGYIVYQWCYSYAPCYGCVEYAYLESSPIPVLRGDGYYYGTIGGKDDEVAREQFWWAISSGSKGYSWGVGAGDAGSAFASGWASYMTQAGDEAGTAGDFQNRVMPLVTAFVEALPNWQKLAADASNTLITAGRGTRAPYQTEGVQNQYTGATPDTYVSGSYAADGSLALIYFSRGVTTTITINQTLLASGYTATWVDPANTATTTGTPGSTYTKPAGANSAGDHDWLLVLAAPSGGGTVTAQLATAAATAKPDSSIAVTITAQLATAAAAAQPAAFAIVAASLATAAAAAQPDSSIAVAVNTGLATAAATAQPAAFAIVATQLATAAATAQPDSSIAVVVNAGLATATAAAQPTAFAIVATGLATAAATAQPDSSIAVTVTAGLATAAAAAQPAAFAIVAASVATAAATAQPDSSIAVTVTAGLATAAATAQPAAFAIVAAQLATAAAAAQPATVSTSSSGTATAQLATAAAAAQPTAFAIVAAQLASVTATAQPDSSIAVVVNTGLATATATAQPTAFAIVAAQLATAAATAQPDSSIAVTVNTGLATAPATAQPAAFAIVAAGLATAAAAAQPDSSIAVTVTAQLATAAAAAQPAAFAIVAAGLATAAAAAQPATVSTTSSGTATAQLATAAAAAQPTAFAIAAASAATATTAAQPDSSIAVTVTAGLAAAAATAQQASVPVTAALAAVTAAALQASVPATAALATAAAAAQQAAVSTTGGETSPALETYAFGGFPQIPPGSAVASVTVVIGEWASDPAMGAPAFELHAADGTLLGSGTGITSTSPANIDQATFSPVTYSQLSGLRVRSYANQGSASPGAFLTVSWVSLVVTFTPAGNAAAVPATLTAAAGFGQCAVSTGETAVLAAALAATAAFPQAAAGLLAASAPAAPLTAAAGFGQCAAAGITNASAAPATLAAAAGFPQAAAGLLAASALAAALAAAAGFPQCAASGVTNASAAPGTLAAAAAFPQAAAGLLAASALAAGLAAAAGFPPAAASGIVNAAITAATLAAVAAVPACLVVAAETGPDYAGSADDLGNGTGAWVDPAGATGSPDPAEASWAVT